MELQATTIEAATIRNGSGRIELQAHERLSIRTRVPGQDWVDQMDYQAPADTTAQADLTVHIRELSD